MYRLSIIVDTSEGPPTTVEAVEVEYNAVTEDWDEVVDGETFEAVSGNAPSWGTDLKWYHMDIDTTGFYSIKIDSTIQEGYEGKFIQVTDLTAAVASNTTHRTAESGNPHDVTKSDVGLGNVENYSATNQVANGLTASQIVGLSPALDVDDLADDSGKFITVSDTLAGMTDGSANANNLLDFIGTRLGANALFAKMMAEVLTISNGTATPVSSVTPKKIGHIYIDTSAPAVYIAYGTANTDWIAIAEVSE